LLFPGERIRLLRDFPDAGLAQGAECEVVNAVAGGEGNPDSVEIKWYDSGAARTVTVPSDAAEPVLSTSTEERTAVFWGLQTPSARLVETAIHFMQEHGFLLAPGLNMAQLHYDASQRWWKRGEPFADPDGSRVATSAYWWDGCVVSFGGEQGFHLEFRLKGREASLLLHERDAVYAQQLRRTHASMELARVLMDLLGVCAAQFCAFPVAYPWITDEDWGSLLQPPYYPDIFLLPRAQVLPDLPAEFRDGRQSYGRTIATVLPVKFAPHDSPPQPGERELALGSLRKCKALGEKYYGQLYEARFGTAGLYSSAKDAFYDAISLANQLGLKEEAAELERRLQNIKGVFRSQFT
jgi:hypothetical protein